MDADLSVLRTGQQVVEALEKRPERKEKYLSKLFPPTKISLPIIGQDFTFYMDIMFITSLTVENDANRGQRKTKGENIREFDNLHYNYHGSPPEYSCALVLIEATSRWAWAYPLHSKNAKEILFVFKKFLENINMRISKLISDSGKEYNEIKKYNNAKHLFHYFQTNASQNTHTTLSRVDRFIRTLREILKEYYNTAKYPNWVPILDVIVKRYNRTFHSSLFLEDPKRRRKRKGKFIYKKIYYTPEQVWKNPELRRRIKIKDYLSKYKNYEKLDRKFKIGTVVRYRVMPGQLKYGKKNGFISANPAIIRERIGNSFRIQLKTVYDGNNEFTGSIITVPARDLCLNENIRPSRSRYNIENLMYLPRPDDPFEPSDSEEEEEEEEEPPPVEDFEPPAPPPPPAPREPPPPPPPPQIRTRSGRTIRRNMDPNFLYDTTINLFN